MTRLIQGPCLISDVSIEGFDESIRIGPAHSITFEHITLRDYRRAGLVNTHRGAISIRKLDSSGSGPAVVNRAEPGLIAIIDSVLRSSDEGDKAAAIENNGRLFARRVESIGFQHAAISHSEQVNTSFIDEFTSDPVILLAGDTPRSLDLPVRDVPTPFIEFAGSPRVNVRSFGADPNDPGDDTESIRAAFNDGSPIVYFPRLSGRAYGIQQTIDVPAHVRRIDVGFAALHFSPNDSNNPFMFRVEEASEHPLEIINMTTQGRAFIHHNSPRTLILRNIRGMAVENGPGAGDLFLSNVAGSRLRLMHPQNVWARQFNPESRVFQNDVINRGGRLWILGFKTEMPFTVMQTVGGGETEIIGGEVFPVVRTPPRLPALVVDHGRMSFSLSFKANQPDAFYRQLVRAHLEQGTEQLNHREANHVGDGGSVVTLGVLQAGDQSSKDVRSQRVSIEPVGTPAVVSGASWRIRVHRHGDTAAAVPVRLRWAGTGVREEWLTRRPEVIDIPQGETTVELSVPTDASLSSEVPGVVSVSIDHGESYTLSWPHRATLSISADGVDEADKARDAVVPRDGLVLWLRADRGLVLDHDDDRFVVSGWLDQSGLEHHAWERNAYYRPVWRPDGIAGRPAVEFDMHHLSLPDYDAIVGGVTPFDSKTVLVHLKTGTDVTTRQIVWTQGFDRLGLSIYLDEGRLYAGSYNHTGYDGTTAWGSAFTSAEVDPDTAYVVAFVSDGDRRTARLYVSGDGWSESTNEAGRLSRHGRAIWDWATSMGANHSLSLFRFHDGQHNPRFGYYFQGQIAEVLQYNRALENTEVAEIVAERVGRNHTVGESRSPQR